MQVLDGPIGKKEPAGKAEPSWEIRPTGEPGSLVAMEPAEETWRNGTALRISGTCFS